MHSHISVLQINTDRRRAAQDLLMATAQAKGSDIIIVSEPNKKTLDNSKWYRDIRGDVCIIGRNKALKITEWGKGEGWVWVRTQGMVICGVYISPNVPVSKMEDLLNDLEREVLNKDDNILIAGDFNSKSPYWGAPLEDRRGALLVEWMHTWNLVVINKGKKPTFERGDSRSHIDITMATEGLSRNTSEWQVLDEDSLSLHKYISYRISCEGRGKRTQWRKAGLNKERFRELCTREETLNNGEADFGEYTATLGRVCREATVRVRTDEKGNPPYWWSQDIAEQRAKLTSSRRRLQRYRTRPNGEARNLEELEDTYKAERRLLKRMIGSAKAGKWKEVCNDLETDIWGRAYKIVVDGLKPRVPETDLSENKLNEFIEELFPVVPRRNWTWWHTLERPVEISEEEYRNALAKLKENKAAGPEGIYTEAVKILDEVAHNAMFRIVNRAFEENTFHRMWKTARVILIPKPGKDLNTAGGYRPICLMDAFPKFLEAIILGRLEQEAARVGGISDTQYGFRKGRSTVGAINRIIRFIKDVGARNNAVLILFDIKNAFNSADWGLIIQTMERRSIEGSLIELIKAYLQDRHLVYGERGRRPVDVGVPQGSVLGPMLWNLLFDGVLSLNQDQDELMVAYADDLAVVARGSTVKEVVDRGNSIIARVDAWTAGQGLRLAIEKTEIVLFSGRRRPKGVVFKMRDREIYPKKEVKYLGVMIDRLLIHGKHIHYACERAERVVSALGRILPSVGGPSSNKRRVMAQAATSILLYAAPVWEGGLRVARNRARMLGVQRKMALRITSAYRTVSTEAVLLIAAQIPINILANERRRVYEAVGEKTIIAERERGVSLRAWQAELDSGVNGRWTLEVIGQVEAWFTKKHGQVNYHTTQFLSGHGNFMTYLRRIGKAEHDECFYCGEVDTPAHAIISCRREEAQRLRLELEIGERIEVGNIIELALESKRNWNGIFGYIEEIMKRRGEDLQIGQQNP